MALNAYSLCPGGTGKKIKFCCPDFLSELEKIDRMMDGEQFIACLQHINQLEQKGQYRACLMATKSELLRVTNQLDAAVAYAADFVQRFPQNVVAWSESALLAAATESGLAGMAKLQRAIALCDGTLQHHVYEAAVVVANVLIQEGHSAAGRALLHLLTSLDPQDRESMERLMHVNRSAQIPLLLKSDAAMLPCPPDVPWRAKFDAAMAPLRKARWQETAEGLTALAAEVSDAPAVWNDLALVRSWLGDEAGAGEAFQKLAALPVPWEDAMEFEAIAMLLSESPLGDDVDIVRWTWPVRDHERLYELLLSDHRAAHVPVDTAAWPAGDSPPPRMTGMLLDRPTLDIGESFSLDNMPSVLAQLLLFGRETDRPARLEVVGLTRLDADQAKTLLRQIGGDTLEAEPEETLMAKMFRQPSPDRTPLGSAARRGARRSRCPLGPRLSRRPAGPLAGPAARRAGRPIVAASGRRSGGPHQGPGGHSRHATMVGPFPDGGRFQRFAVPTWSADPRADRTAAWRDACLAADPTRPRPG